MDAVKALCGGIVSRFYIIIPILVIINIITFIVYGIDKKKSKTGAWRTPEKTLIALSFCGGAVGAFLAMKLLRHKTQHLMFQILVPLSLLLWIALLVAVIWLGVFA